jgi:hypothetical protein
MLAIVVVVVRGCVYSLVRLRLEREPHAGGRRRKDRVDAARRAGARRVESAVCERERHRRGPRKRRRRRWAPRRHPWRPRARSGHGHGGLLNAGHRRWHTCTRRRLEWQRRPRAVAEEVALVGTCGSSVGRRCRGEAEPEPVTGAAATADARGFLTDDGTKRPRRQLGVPQAAAIPDPFVRLPLLLRRLRLLGRLWSVVLVEGLLGHVDGRRRRGHAEGRGAMRVADEVQVRSRDHPGCRRLMPSARPSAHTTPLLLASWLDCRRDVRDAWPAAALRVESGWELQHETGERVVVLLVLSRLQREEVARGGRELGAAAAAWHGAGMQWIGRD